MKYPLSLGIACTAALLACGGGSSSNPAAAAVSGTLGGEPVAATDAIALQGPSSGLAPYSAWIILTNLPGFCAVEQGHHNPPNAQELTLEVFEYVGALGPGTYGIGSSSSQLGEAAFSATDASCNPTAASASLGVGLAASGTITLSSVSATEITGSFDLTFSPSNHITGTFSAPVCNATVMTFPTGPAPACGS
jgi:hypothetical protein